MRNFIPNSFQVPNALVDKLIAEISGNALKCYMIIIRKTRGWGKSSDKISTTQFMEISGIKDKRTIQAALKELENLGLIKQEKSSGLITEFSLVMNEDELGTKNVSSNNNCTELGAKNVPATRYKKCTSTKETIKNKLTKEKEINKENPTNSSTKRIKKSGTPTPVPESFTPTANHIAFYEQYKLDKPMDLLVKAFLANHEAKGSMFVSWNAAFTTWLTNQAEWKIRDEKAKEKAQGEKENQSGKLTKKQIDDYYNIFGKFPENM